MARRRENPVAFEAIRVEGALLQPEWLVSIARCGAGQQKDEDYGVPEGMNLREEIGRYWRMAKAQWDIATVGANRNAEPLVVAEALVRALLGRCLGFASLAPTAPIMEEDRSYPLGFTALGGRVPVVIAPFGGGFDALATMYGDVGRKRTPFGLAQEYLNAAKGALWGIVSDGKRLRILRDNASLTRPAWIEVDLARIFTEDRYAEFAVFWLLAHESRFGRAGQPAIDCALEAWREAGRKAGTRARERLRDGVEAALVALGSGFIEHADNGGLRAALSTGTLTDDGYFQELLRLVYRLIFLLTAEERDYLHPKAATPAARKLYQKGYGVGQLRERAVRRNAYDGYSDQWEAVRIVFRGLVSGEPTLGLPALGGLFAPTQTPTLDKCRIANGRLLDAVFNLSWLRDLGSLTRVNWRDMGPEELGSVYEGLLELIPEVSAESRTFAFADESIGNARKKSGSYYTPESLVQVLLDGALDPVIRATIAENPSRPADALLDLTIVDPACGSGHFLLAAARRLAEEVARLRAGATPTDSERRHALRQVVGRCVYGVDLNPMAVELCRVALWMEAVEPGLPLTFLNAHIRHGNALVGVTPGLMGDQVPDAAWGPLEGDDRAAARALKGRNEREAQGQMTMTSLWSRPQAELGSLARDVAELDAAADDSPAALAAKEAKWAAILGSPAYQHQQFVADAWCAAFVWPKPTGADITGRPLAAAYVDAAPTTGLWRDIRDNRGNPPALTVTTTRDLAEQYHFFHWHLAFPTVFERGGFDVVLGNPPWERVKLQEIEFFASRDRNIAGAVNAAERKRLIQRLPLNDPPLWEAWTSALRESDGQTRFIRDSARYPLCGKGDINTYALFAEHNRAVLAPSGRAGFIVPTGIATDDSTKDYFGALVEGSELARFYSFENEDLVFPGVHHSFRFGLLCLDHAGAAHEADLVFFARQAADLADPARHFSLSGAEFSALNPNTRTCPTFRARRDADLNVEIYRRAGVLWRDGHPEGNPWGVSFAVLFHMANDSGLFRSRRQLEDSGYELADNRFVAGESIYLPLIEAKMLHMFDHRFGTYDGQTQAQENQGKLPELTDEQHADPELSTLPYFWVESGEVLGGLRTRWDRAWLLGWRDICRTSDSRTLIASLLPMAAVGHTTPLLFPSAPPGSIACLYANLCSFILDYAARQKVGGTHITYGYIKQFPVLPPGAYVGAVPWDPRITGQPLPTMESWLLPRVVELTYTAWDLQPFARDVGLDGAPFRWEGDRRRLLRAELDAAFFHLYEVSRDDASYILDTFPIVRQRDPDQAGLILGIYDAMAEAMRTGAAYVTHLHPPPADARVRHDYEAEVVALPITVNPRWRELQPGAWASPAFATEAQRHVHAIAATLRALPTPTPMSEVLLLALVNERPWLMTGLLPASDRDAWERVVGPEAVRPTSAPGVDANAWRNAVQDARTDEVFRSVDGQWSAGADVDDVATTTLDARARLVVSTINALASDERGAELIAIQREIEDAQVA